MTTRRPKPKICEACGHPLAGDTIIGVKILFCGNHACHMYCKTVWRSE